MSFESIELWRPRREPGHRLRTALVTLLVLAVLAGSGAAAVWSRRPLVLVLGLAVALVLACLAWRLRGGSREWHGRRPRPWVPRFPGDRRAGSGRDRRDRAPEPAAGREACKPHGAPRPVAMRGTPSL